ncbi:MAG: hypothetical protein KAI34_01920 [Candidatus Lokiarchaeota archaeon]|nr:hypothetical protein [Candidatus Lokiarchaeota archaeon]
MSSKERMKYKTTYLLENKEKLANITRNMRNITLVSLILPLALYIAVATLIRNPSKWMWDWEPLVIVTGLAGASIFHLMWIIVANKGVEIEFRKDPLYAYTKWLRLPLFGATSLIWGFVAYIFLWEWLLSLIFLPIFIFLFIILFKYNNGYYDWVKRIVRLAEKRDKRLQKQEERRKRTR